MSGTHATRTLGRTGLTVTRFGAGGHFTNGPLAHEDIDRRVKELNQILDLGVTYLDVQWDPEELATAEVIKTRGEEFTVAWPLHGVNKQTPQGVADYIKTYCDDHRKRYGVDHVDILLWVGLNLPEESANEMLEAVGAAFEMISKEGFADHFAFSCHHSPEMALKTIGRTEIFDVLMVPYSPLHPAAARELLPAARDRNIGVVAMKNFGGGGGFLNKVWAGLVEHPVVDRFKNSARPYQAALRWVLANEYVDVAVPGAHSAQQIDELFEAIQSEPTSDDEQMLADLLNAMNETGAEVQLRGEIAESPSVWD